MIESSSPSKFTKWKRLLVGGLLSALPAVFYVLTHLKPGPYISLDGILSIILFGLWAPILMLTGAANKFIFMSIMVLFWFLIGILIAQLTRKNILAVGCWFLLYVLFIFMAFALCLFCQ